MITLQQLRNLRQLGALPDKGAVLDIGSSNLYQMDPSGIRAFAETFGYELDADFVEAMAGATLHEGFAGELLERVGLTYLAFDIANGYRTQIFDLNEESVSAAQLGAFDTVLNFGTTEHVINQLNALRVIHDAVKVGGHIVHLLPAGGYLDHGYFCYTPRLFFDLAGHNEYEVIDFDYTGPADGRDIYGIVRDYVTYFPALAKVGTSNRRVVDDMSISIILRKTKDLPLRLPMERSTSVVTDALAVEPPKTQATAVTRHSLIDKLLGWVHSAERDA